MSHSHSHDHKEEADCWTNMGAVGEALFGFASDGYWLSSVCSLFASESDDIIGLSYYGMPGGILLALLSAGGAAYCHRTLNIVHQAEDEQPVNDRATYGSNGVTGPMLPLVSVNPVEYQPFDNKKNLTWLQAIALFGDLVSHIGEYAGVATLFFNLAVKTQSPTRMARGLMQAGAACVGTLFSIANIRTCRNAMRTYNSTALSK